MAEAYPPEINCVYVDTNLDTHLGVLVHDHETISDFKEKLCKEHQQCFPEVGEIDISAVKVKRQNPLGLLLDYHLPNSMCLSMAFEGISNDCWFVYVDAAVRIVDKCELPVIMDADENCPNHELLEQNKEIANDSPLLDGYTKDQSLEEDLETEVVDKTKKKRKLKISDGEKSRKKPSVDPNQSGAVAATTASRFDVDESHELPGNVQVEVVTTESSPREKPDDIPKEETGKEIEMAEKSVEDVGLGREKIETDNLVSHPGSHLDTNSGLTTRPDTEKKKRRKKRSKDDMNQSSAAAITTSIDVVNEINGVSANRVDPTPESLPISRGKNLDNPFAEAKNEMGENSVDDVGRDKIETDNLVSHTENHLETNSELTTEPDKEKKKRRKKSSKDDINQSSSAAITTSTATVNETNGVPANVDPADVTTEALPISRDNPFVESRQKENEMVEKSIKDVGTDNIETDNHLETNSELTTGPDKEKKKRRKKSSKDDINQSSSAAITTSTATVNETSGVPADVDPVDVTPEALPIRRDNPFAESSQKKNEMVEKSVEDVGRDKIETDNLVSHTENHLETNSELTTEPDKEKKKRRKKSSKDDINQSSSAAITTSTATVNETNGVPANVDPADVTPEALPISRDNPFVESSQKENEMVEKSIRDVGRDNIETDNHLETNSELTTRPDKEKKKRRKKSSKDDINQSSAVTTTSGDIVNEITGVPGNVDRVDAISESLPAAEARQKETEMGEKIDGDVGSGKAIPSATGNNVEIDAGETNSVKSTKKRKSKKAKTPAEEDTRVVSSDAQTVEPIKAVEGEVPDNVIRNVLDSLQEKNQTEENMDKTVKKSSKKSKKKHSLKVAESQVLSVEVNNAALEKTPINNPKDADASFFTPAKKDTKSDASLLKKSTEVADNAEDNSLSKKNLIEKADMGDNFGCTQIQEKQDQVAGRAKSKKEKKGPYLHPSSSIDGSLSSVKSKEKKGRAQQAASSGTSHLQSMVKNDRSRSMRAPVSSKKQDVKISSKPVTVGKRKTNFFKDTEKCNSSEDEYNKKTSDVSTKTPSDYSSDDDSDVTSMSRKQGNNLAGGTNKFSGSLQEMVRSSSSYKKALVRSQSQPDIMDDADCVPDSQAV